MRMLEKQLKNYRLTTAEILYHLPDYPELLQTFVWQNLDLAPKFPALRESFSIIGKAISMVGCIRFRSPIPG